MSQRSTTHPLRRARREAAEARQEKRSTRTPAGQLAVLDDRLGAGRGAKRERARLAK